MRLLTKLFRKSKRVKPEPLQFHTLIDVVPKSDQPLRMHPALLEPLKDGIVAVRGRALEPGEPVSWMLLGAALSYPHEGGDLQTRAEGQEKHLRLIMIHVMRQMYNRSTTDG